MNCPKCRGKSKVRSSRPQGQTTRRFRECLRCKHRYNTVEIIEVVAAAKKPAPAKAKPGKRVLTPRPAKAAPAPKDTDRTWGRLEADERISLRDLGL